MQTQSTWTKAEYTAIVSDLHLCEAEPVNTRFPLWKKFKTRQFFFDQTFEDFLKHIESKAAGKTIELVLNGDIFDFDSVMKMPERPHFRISWLERKRGLYPRPERSKHKIEVILSHHEHWVAALRDFIKRGHRAVFVIGNHDLELHFPVVQEEIRSALALSKDENERVRFCEWFYVSNGDSMIEHGNQYDPYCVCEDPVHPFSQGYNFKSIRLPFGNLACRYILNGMGFFNPHVESNFIMSLTEYIRFFMKYMVKAQPTLMFDWLFGAVTTLYVALTDRLLTPIRDPLKIENKVNEISEKSNVEPRVVRELRELFVASATGNPFMIARELWLDRFFLILISFALIFIFMLMVKQVFDISMFWGFIPLFILLPFFLFYSRSVQSMVSSYKEPDERVLSMAGAITGVRRVIYGHTHLIRHEMIGAIEHLNSGCWSAAFTDVECTTAIDHKTYVWIEPTETSERKATLFAFEDNQSREAFALTNRDRRSQKKRRAIYS
jgi:UDP-2,3-diacylglucosamine pyrophosphatase LpxH